MSGSICWRRASRSSAWNSGWRRRGTWRPPGRWRTALPWLADILAGLVYYFAGMLAAQREARWYGSRCLALPAALGCTILVWTVSEFWLALLAIVFAGTLMATAA